MTLKEEIYHKMYEDIVSGNYAPNDIITEASLIAKYKVSKSPIREALIELCKDGVLQSLPRLGYQVVPVSLKEVLDVIDFRIDVELAGLKRSFGNLDEGSLRELEKIAHIPEKELENPKWDRNLNFHTSLYELSDNQYGLLELQKVMRENERFLSQHFQSAWTRASMHTMGFHDEIIDALRKGNLEKALGFLEADIRAIKDEILKRYSFFGGS